MIPPRTEPILGPICVLVVDDEAPARLRLVDLLRQQPAVATILEAEDGAAAMASIEQRLPDLVFLDVQMPEIDGLGVLERILERTGLEAMPLTVFVTAYDQHAVRAFEANALDYLLKPFSDERFEATMARVRSRLNERSRLDERSLHDFGRRLMRMISAEPTSFKSRYLDRLVVKSGGATRFIRVADIDWIEAAGVYVNLHIHLHANPLANLNSMQRSGHPAEGKEILYRSSLAELAERLDPARFVRVHRSTIVNIDSILQLEPISHGEFDVVLKNGARTRISRSFRAQLEERLGQSL
jgi:two-component system LytT family response regulator